MFSAEELPSQRWARLMRASGDFQTQAFERFSSPSVISKTAKQATKSYRTQHRVMGNSAFTNKFIKTDIPNEWDIAFRNARHQVLAPTTFNPNSYTTSNFSASSNRNFSDLQERPFGHAIHVPKRRSTSY